MAWFKRQPKNTAAAIPELEWYNKAEKKERSGLAWLLAIASIATAGLLIIGLVFGGRWVYRHFKSNDKPETTQNDTSKDENKTDGTTATGTPSSGDTAATPAPATTPTTTPVTAPTVLTNTGPADTLAIFLSVTLLSVIVYQLKLRKV